MPKTNSFGLIEWLWEYPVCRPHNCDLISTTASQDSFIGTAFKRGDWDLVKACQSQHNAMREYTQMVYSRPSEQQWAEPSPYHSLAHQLTNELLKIVIIPYISFIIKKVKFQDHDHIIYHTFVSQIIHVSIRIAYDWLKYNCNATRIIILNTANMLVGGERAANEGTEILHFSQLIMKNFMQNYPFCSFIKIIS